MSEENPESAKIKSIPVVIQSEGIFNAGIILTESNYDIWSQLMEMQIAERDKISYIRGKTKPPAESDEGYEKWYAENQKVKRWLLMSMSPDIMRRYLRLPTAHSIWTALSTAFYDGSDELQVFTLNQKAFSARQNGRILSMYYGELTELFQELDHRDKVVMKDSDDVKTYRQSIERLRVHIFLAGLDDAFDSIRREILRKDLVPNLEECYSLVRREEVRSITLKGDSKASEPSAMVARNRSSQGQQPRAQPNTSRWTKDVDKSSYKCAHCHKTGHTKSGCFELVGYPEWWDPSRAKKNHQKPSTTAVAQTKMEDEITDNASALVIAADNGGKVLNILTPVLNNAWIIDSGATDHMTYDSRQVSPLNHSNQKFVSTANGSSIQVIGEGSLTLTKTLNLDSVLVVPSLDYNLLSVSQITTALSCIVIFWPDFCVFKDIKTRTTIGCGIRRGKLYYLDLESKSTKSLQQALAVGGSEDRKRKEIWLRHRRFGHASFRYLKRLFPSLFTDIDISSFHCDTCELAKSHRASFPLRLNKSPFPFMIIHSDVWGPSKVTTLGGSRWFVTFIDDCTRMTWLCLMKSKSEVNSIFQKFHTRIETQYNRKIQIIHSDNGGEYHSTEFQHYLETQGIIHHTTCPTTPQQNGVAERKNRHLLEIVRALLIEAHMPLSYWGEALTAAAYLINRVPSSTLNFKTPFQSLNDTIVTPTVSNLTPHVFGCVVFVHLHKHQCTKLTPQALRCVFVGYATHQKGYRCYHPPTRRLFITMDVVFHEDTMYFSKPEFQGEYQEEIRSLDHDNQDVENLEVTDMALDPWSSSSQIDMILDQNCDENQITEEMDHSLTQQEIEIHENIATSPVDISHQSFTEDVPEPHRRQLPQRHTRGIPKSTYEPELSSKAKYPMSHYVSNHRLSESNMSFVNQLSAVSIPNSVQEALSDPRWKEAMNEEMKSLEKNETWELVDPPSGKKPVGCRWIYTVKYKADGTIERFKARLVAKGYTQTYGIDYTETFAPVAKINTVRVLLSLAANLDWPLQQFDVKNAFLHGELSEEVYMDLPPGCMIPKRHSQKICRLKKSLYGLKQSPRAWFGRFTKSMIAFGYHQSNADHTLFLKRQQGKITALIIYVDDMVVTGNDPNEREALQNYLSKEFEMKDLGPLNYFLGIEVSRSRKGIVLSQRKYALDLLRETGMSACQPVDTPVEEGLKLYVESDQVPVDKARYQRLVGRLLYLSHTRPDLTYALSIVSQFMHNPGEQHMNAVIRILRYLKSAPGKGVLFTKNTNHQNIEAYTDADWAGNLGDRRSTSGYFTFLGGNLVTWKSKKQNVVARSSAEAEFRGLANVLCETLWLRLLLHDLGYLSEQPIQLFCDSKAACDIAHNPVQHDRTKHVEVDRFFIKEKLDGRIVELPKIRSEDQLADILTKAVSSRVFLKFLDKLGMWDIYAPT